MATVAEASQGQSRWWPRLFGSRSSRGDPGDNVDGLVRSYADGLFVTAQGLSQAKGDDFDVLAERALVEARAERPELRDVLSLEIRLVQLLSPEDRARRYWDYRERFERLASATELAAYLASGPPPHPKTGDTTTPSLDSDMRVLLDHIHRSYMLTLVREGAVRDLKKWVQSGLVRGGSVFFVIILLLLLFSQDGILPSSSQILPEPFVAFFIGLITLFYLGRLGAAMSVIQRLQRAVREIDRDPFFEITALCTGRRGISIAMLSGGIFALLLYVVFAAGLGERLGMAGGIFPQVGEASPADAQTAARSSAAPRAQDGSKDSDTAEPSNTSTQTVTEETANLSGPVSGNGSQAVEPTAAAPATSNISAAAPPGPGPQAREPKEPTEQTAGALECGPSKTDCMPTWVGEIGKHLGFRSYPDFFKMLLLAFLAGFAERLVPDAIDRLTRRQGSASPEASAAPAQPVQRS